MNREKESLEIDVTNGDDDDRRSFFETHSHTASVLVLTDRMTDLSSISADWLVDYYRLHICFCFTQVKLCLCLCTE